MSQAATTTANETSLVLVHDGNISNRNQARALGLSMELNFKSVQEINILQQQPQQQPGASQLIIGCGHKASRYVCNFTGQSSNTKTVQILHPRFPLQSSTDRFDCLVLPEHDCERYWFELDLNPNKVIKMHGSLGWNLDYFSLLRYRQRARARHPTKKTLVMLMGGSLLHPELFRELEDQQDLHVEYITSRRTKQVDMLPSNANNLDYREALACGDYFAVDADSISMVTDALMVMSERNIPTPLYLFSTPPHAKHSRFIAQLSSQHSPNLFERLETVKQITTARAARTNTAAHHLIHFPNEAQRVAALVRRMLNLL